MLLQHKIFVGYFFSVAIIGIMVAILLYEQSRIKEIAANSVEINRPVAHAPAILPESFLTAPNARYKIRGAVVI